MVQPALIDRLQGEFDIPQNVFYGRFKRDLKWLLNTVRLERNDEPLDAYPAAAISVINYGIPELCGHTIRRTDVSLMENWLRVAIKRFEPRINPDTLVVQRVEDEGMNHNQITFEIRGDLWTYPVPLELLIRTEVDLDTGNWTVPEQ